MNDEIVEQVRRNREEILRSFGSKESYYTHITHTQSNYGNRLVSRSPKRIIVEQDAGGQRLPLARQA